MDLTLYCLESGVKQTDIDDSKGAEGVLISEELAERRQLLRENRVLTRMIHEDSHQNAGRHPLYGAKVTPTAFETLKPAKQAPVSRYQS